MWSSPIFTVMFILLILSFVGIIAGIGFWVYQDAKIRSDKPKTWAIIAIITPYLFGLINYLLAGRSKPGKSATRYKIPAIAGIASFAFMFIVFLGYTFFSDPARLPVISGVSIGAVTINGSNNWRLSVSTSGATYNRTVNLNAQQLRNFHVTSESLEGSITLSITQGTTDIEFDISNFYGNIDLTEYFLPDMQIRLRIINSRLRGGRILLEW